MQVSSAILLIFACMQIALESFTIGDKAISIFVPDSVAIQKKFHHQHAPYWTQVWHAAVGLCIFLQQHPDYIKNKTVLELGAGLGLPGIVAATIAKHVSITDKSKAAVTIVQQSVLLQQLKNVSCKVVDWNDSKGRLIPEVVLLSDINYEPDAFAPLLSMINYFLENNCTIILSTPQRLMAKAFIEQVLVNCANQATISVLLREKKEDISVFVLVKK